MARCGSASPDGWNPEDVSVSKKCVYLHLKIDASFVGNAKKSICIGPLIKVRQILTQGQTILMPFVSAYVLALCHYISEHRIRFKVGFTCGRRLAMPNECRTNNASSMLFRCIIGFL